MQVINIDNLPVISKSTPKMQNKQQYQSFAPIGANAFGTNTFLSSAQREQDMTYTDYKRGI